MPSSFRLASWLALRLLGATYLVAFLSLGLQVRGLVGSRGILPVAEHLAVVEARFAEEAAWVAPTLFWLDDSDRALVGACLAGAALSALVVAGLLPGPALLGAWVLYLSLSVVGQVFLSFQWDTLLLETGLLAVFLSPWRPWHRVTDAHPPPALALWLLRLLLVKLMFLSGALKLTSGDPSWRGLAALLSHYETQPLPTWIGWYAHQLPEVAHRASVLALFGIELVVPLFLLAPGRWRRGAALVLALLQLSIAATGNYGFFNVLTLVLCLLQVDDAPFPRRWLPPAVRRQPSAFRLANLAAAPLALVWAVLSAVHLAGALDLSVPWPRAVVELHRRAAPFRSVNGYGLFAVMTTERLEIVVEGSADGRRWTAYPFRWKPGDLDRAPAFVQPHQPRLDWQMWFAALGSAHQSPWFLRFVSRLAEGEPAVVGLLADDPFPEGPPRFLRARLYEYRFSDLKELRRSGRWWRREERGPYLPVLESRPGE